MIKKIEESNTEELTHRRKGGAFDDFARILRKINKLVFNTGTTLNDRPGIKEARGKTTGFVESDSVFEIFQRQPRAGTYNFIVIGKKGSSEENNTNYIDLSVNSRTGETSPANGTIGLRLNRNGIKYANAKISLYEGSNYADLKNLEGARAEITGEGNGGGVQLTYINGSTLLAFILDRDGVQLYGLPTTNPGVGNKLWNDGGTLKITNPS